LKLAAVTLIVAASLSAQTVEVYSEFQRVDSWGHLLDAEAAPPPREIISPAVPRNGFTSFHIAVTARPGLSYFLFVQANPPNLVEPKLYKEFDDRLEPVPSPNFGVIPDGQTTRVYLLDIWVPPDAEPGRRVRLELQLKVGDWIVYPLELRIQKASVPTTAGRTAPASLEQVTNRNARQDAAFEATLNLPEVWFLTAQHIADSWTARSPFSAAVNPEWYLKVRDLLYRRANAR